MSRWLVGVDLTAGGRSTTVAALADDLSQSCLEAVVGDDAIVAFVRAHRPGAVAIDSPIGVPDGQCCLELGCPCAPLGSGKGRACERALSRLGIPSYYTSKRSIIKAMVYRAMGLRAALEREGYRVLEVYPYATKVRLFGHRPPRKTTVEGRAFLERKLGELLGRATGPLSHDQADALLCAYMAWLWTQGHTQALGEPSEGQIHVPKDGWRREVGNGMSGGWSTA